MQSTQRLAAFTIVGLAGLFLVYEFILQISPSIMTNEFMHTFHIDAFALGAAMAFYYYTYAPMQIVAGLAFDWLGARATLALASILCALGTLLVAQSEQVFYLKLGRAFTGMGSACAYIGVLFLGKRWFAARYFFLVVGITQFLGCMGAVFGQGPTAYIVSELGWRSTLNHLALIGTLIALLILIIIRDQPKVPINPEADYPAPETHVLKNLVTTMKSAQTWAVGLYAFAIFAPMAAFAALWGVPFLKTMYNINDEQAGLAVSIIWVSNGIFSGLTGWVSEKIKSRNIPLTITAWFGVVLSLIILYVPVPFPVMCVLMVLFGIATAGQSLSFNVINDNTPAHRSGTAMGFNNMLVVLTGAVMQPLVGLMLRLSAEGNTSTGVPIYSIEDFQYALVVMPIFFGIAGLVGLFWLKETHCKSTYSHTILTASDGLGRQK
jgi:MFS family permease